MLAAHLTNAGRHPIREVTHRGRAHLVEKFASVSEVPVRRIGYNSDHPGCFPEDDRVGAARSRKL
jgi:hypothetical protein